MKRDDFVELHYIAPIDNAVSICREGMLCHRLAASRRHRSVAMEEIQQRRTRKTVPGGRPLHEYANLYFHARNPMLFKRRDQHADLCVFRVRADVLDLPHVIISDQNAASDYARFYPAPDGLRYIDRDMVFAEYWTHPEDVILEFRHKSVKCAEVLVPDRIEPSYIAGAYVSNPMSKGRLDNLLGAAGIRLEITVNERLFFLRGTQ